MVDFESLDVRWIIRNGTVIDGHTLVDSSHVVRLKASFFCVVDIILVLIRIYECGHLQLHLLFDGFGELGCIVFIFLLIELPVKKRQEYCYIFLVNLMKL